MKINLRYSLKYNLKNSHPLTFFQLFLEKLYITPLEISDVWKGISSASAIRRLAFLPLSPAELLQTVKTLFTLGSISDSVKDDFPDWANIGEEFLASCPISCIPVELGILLKKENLNDFFWLRRTKYMFIIYIYLLMNLIFTPPPVPSSLKWAGIASGELSPALWRIIWIRTSGALLSQLLPQTILTSCIIRHFFKAAFQNLKSIVSLPFIQVWRLGV